MKAYGNWQSVGRSARVLPALLVGLLLAPSAACASCGDYVVQGGNGHAAPPLLTTSRSGVMPPASHPRPHQPGEGPAPCSGPLCSRGSFVPPVPVTGVTTHGNEWGYFSAPA